MPLQGWPWRRLSKSSQNSDIHLETHIRPNRRRLGLPWAPGRHHGARLLPHGLHHLHVQQRPPLACQGPRVKYLPPVCCLGPLKLFSVKIIKIYHILVTRKTLPSCYRTQSKYFMNASGFSPSLPRLVLDWFRACSSPSGNPVRIDDIIIKYLVKVFNCQCLVTAIKSLLHVIQSVKMFLRVPQKQFPCVFRR